MHAQLLLLPGLLAAHIELALFALLLGAAVSIPLGIYIARYPRLQGVVLGIASIIQTIPSLALLAIMVPGLALLSLFLQRHLGTSISSIGYLPALIALMLYSILPIMRNTVTGLTNVDPALVQAAKGVGMTGRQQLFRVELPQALPVIIAGVRTAMVWVVGMTVLSTPVGAASLGNYIFSGLQTRNYAAISVGCLAAAGLALFLDWLIRSLELGLQRRQAWRFRLALACLVGLYGFVGVRTVQRLMPQPGLIRIGAKTFTEQYILAEVLAQQVRQQTGRPVEIVQSLGSSLAFDALKSGAIDAYVEYTGAAWSTLMHRHAIPQGDTAMLTQVRQFLKDRHGIEVAAELGFSNTYALGMRRSRVEALHISSLQQLVAMAPQLRIAGDYEVFDRNEYSAMRQAYGLHFAQERSMDPSLMYDALLSGEVDLVTAYSSDGRLQAYDLTLLEDSRHSLPPYDALILVGRQLQQDPQALAALKDLGGSIDLPRMQKLNYAVDHDRRAPQAVAQQFIASLKKPADPLLVGQRGKAPDTAARQH